MSNTDFYFATWELKEKIEKIGAIQANNETLLSKNFEISLQDLLYTYNCPSEADAQIYLACLIIHRIIQDAPLGPGCEKYLPYFDFLYKSNISFKESLIENVSSWLVHEISEFKTIDDLLEFAKEFSNKAYYQEMNIVTGSMNSNFLKFILQDIDSILELNNTEQILDYIKNCAKGQIYRIECLPMIEIIVNTICNYVENIYKNSRNNVPAEQNRILNEAREIISHVKAININGEQTKNRIENIELDIGKCIVADLNVMSEVNSSQVIASTKNPHLINDFNNIQFLDVIFTTTNDKYTVSVYKAWHNKIGDLAVKIYYSKKGENLLYKFASELEILDKLSELASTKNCFMKYYGSWVDQNCLYIAMEYHSCNLMEAITHYRSTNTKIPEEALKFMIIKLLESFATMESKGIYHKDIKPHNILLTKNFDLKIIDFSVSDIKEITESTLVTDSGQIQGTKGYMAPELQSLIDSGRSIGNYNIKKADVFSLGITLLQIILMEDLATLNRAENNKLLMQKVDLISTFWIKNMLSKMLILDYNKRPSFKALLMEVPGDSTMVI